MLPKASLLIMFLIFACGPRLRAPITDDGGVPKIQIVVDKNLSEDLSKDHVLQRTIIINDIAEDLGERFEKVGYQIGLQVKKGEIKLAESFDHILLVTVKKFHLRNRTALTLVGKAAGPAILGLDYTLYDRKITPVLSNSLSIASIVSEEKCVRALNSKIFNAVHAKMVEMY